MARFLLAGLPTALLLVVLVLFSVGWQESEAGGEPTLTAIFPAVDFSGSLVDLDFIPGQPGRYLSAELDGVISLLDEADESAKVEIRDLGALTSDGNEEGLFGLAFDPEFNGTTNRRVYVYYSASSPRRGILARYNYTGSGFQNGKKLMAVRFAEGREFHFGGDLQFGPDGMLYLGPGDGGNGGAVSQNKERLPGKILRVDVSGDGAVAPPDNPFFGSIEGHDKVFASGFRNPWRFGFDSVTGVLWAGDVGANQWEEIDKVRSGKNYGWNKVEGPDCINPPTGCDRTGLTAPVAYYSHEDDRCSILGGHVYRGDDIPSLAGQYIFGDFCTGVISKTPASNPGSISTVVGGAGFGLVSFAPDSEGEIIAVYRDALHRID